MTIRIKRIALIALFSAVGSILMYFDFPLPIAPAFMKMDLAELPVIISGFVLGPIEGIFVAILKVLIKFILKGTSTMFVGEFANIIGSISYVLPASIIYYCFKTKKNAIIGLFIGTVLSSIICTFCNALLIFPIYMKVFSINEDAIIKMCSAIFPFINSLAKVYLFSILPFNVLKYTVTSCITYLFYKSISKQLKSILK